MSTPLTGRLSIYQSPGERRVSIPLQVARPSPSEYNAALRLRSNQVKPRLLVPHSISREGVFTNSVSDKNESDGRLVYWSAGCGVTAEYGKNICPLHKGDDREVILMHQSLDDGISLLSGVIACRRWWVPYLLPFVISCCSSGLEMAYNFREFEI